MRDLFIIKEQEHNEIFDFINSTSQHFFISTGYVGRASDKHIVQDSGLL